MKNIQRNDFTISVRNLPKLKYNSFQFNDEICFTGTIIRRKLEGSPLWHYAIIYGIDQNGSFLMIENNKDGVECVTWDDFLGEKGVGYEIVQIEKTPHRQLQILRRVLERADLPYHLFSNNCEHFTNYSANAKIESFQAEFGKKIGDALLSLIECKVMECQKAFNVELISGWDDVRRRLHLERNEATQKYINLMKGGSC